MDEPIIDQLYISESPPAPSCLGEASSGRTCTINLHQASWMLCIGPFLEVARASWARFSSITPDEASRLRGIWDSAAEVVLPNIAGEAQLVLVPISAEAQQGEADEDKGVAVQGSCSVPPFFANHVVFALTAFDPPGISRTLQDNIEANRILWNRLTTDKEMPTAAEARRSFGFDAAEGWREDGFCLAYPLDEASYQHW